MLHLNTRIDSGPLWSDAARGGSVGGAEAHEGDGESEGESEGDGAGAHKPVLALGHGLVATWSQGAARVIRKARGFFLPGAERPAPATALTVGEGALESPLPASLEALIAEELGADAPRSARPL